MTVQLVTVEIDADSQALIRRWVASGRYRDAAEAIREALRVLDERERLEELRAKVAAGFASADDGELVELTPELMDQLAREADEMARLGIPPDPDVCP